MILGIDWGQSKIGLALGSAETRVASPFKVVKNISEVLEIVKQEKIELIVVGEPVKMSGDKTNLTDGFAEFVNQLKKAGFTVVLVDERLTTRQADSLIVGSRKISAQQDAVAAMLILQSYFDSSHKITNLGTNLQI